ncbi:protein CLN8-like [Mytilus californianus]|uniref:protein CLN8-like n=1 Tax=Mytilus californianus TaxID=6549 RepID=UPI002247391E|nr:protein CLN8-like [Mytilus californianus]
MGWIRYILSALEDIDYSQQSSKLLLVVVFFVTYAIGFVISGLFSTSSTTYVNLSKKEQIFWNSGFVRSCYTIVCVGVCLRCLFVDKELQENVMYETTPTSFIIVISALGFFVFECTVLTFSDISNRKFSFLLQIHHWIGLLILLQLVLHNVGHFFAARLLLLELSAPFTFTCWILLKFGKGNTTIWKLNQCLLVHVYHFRSFIEITFCYYVFFKYRNDLLSELTVPVYLLSCTYALLLTFVLTPYWTYKKTTQLFIRKDFEFSDSTNQTQLNGHVKKCA